MGLKQIQKINRIIFLKKFTAELILNSMKEQELKKRITVEKLKQRFFPKQEKAFKESFEKRYEIKKPEEVKKEIKLEEYQKSISKIKKQTAQTQQIRPMTPTRLTIRQPQSTREITKETEEQEVRKYNIISDIENKTTQEIRAKIQELLKDSSVHMIECPGPEKNLLVKRYNQILVTKITLTQKEITSIIEDFSRRARIPSVNGILKAAVGNLIISAVISEYVGSRFIMSKITPYSLIE